MNDTDTNTHTNINMNTNTTVNTNMNTKQQGVKFVWLGTRSYQRVVPLVGDPVADIKGYSLWLDPPNQMAPPVVGKKNEY